MSSHPPRDALDAINSGTVNITRRVEIYESDGETLWSPDIEQENFARLIDGSVPVEYNSAERRKLDLTLDNRDKLLRPNPNNGFWYDKIIKAYWGVKYDSVAVAPPTVVIEAPSNTELNNIINVFSRAGFDKTSPYLTASNLPQLDEYEYVISYTGSGATAKSVLLNEAFTAGKKVITVGTGNGTAHIPFYISQTVAGSAITWGVTPTTNDSPTLGSFANEAASPTATGIMPTAITAWATTLAVWTNTPNPTFITATIASSPQGGRWLDIHLPNLNGVEARKLLRAALSHIRNYQPVKYWECQLGTFMIDNMSEDNFPDQIKITGRDYTKKLLLSKIPRTSTFVAGTPLKSFVSSVAQNGGILSNKLRLSIGDEVLTSDMSFERGSDRWALIKNALDSFNYEVFFDNQGNLVARKFFDPTTSLTSWSFKTGVDGNLVTFNKSINDSRVYNDVLVYGDPADGEEARLPYFGQATNTDQGSPTNIYRMGRRTAPPLITTWLGSDLEAEQLAKDRLKIYALESYDLNFTSIYYPWLECGEIIEILDPDSLDFEPNRFLLDNITYQLGLGPMSATGKRITFVGSSGGDDSLEEAV